MHFRPEIFQQQREKEMESEVPITESKIYQKQKMMEDSLGASPTNIIIQKREYKM